MVYYGVVFIVVGLCICFEFVVGLWYVGVGVVLFVF